jgi:hypothetical protein
MQSIQEKFKVDIDKLRTEQISILRKIFKDGTAHLKYYHSTMIVFQYPERRIKTFDTKYYEEVLPEVSRIIREYDQSKKNKINA